MSADLSDAGRAMCHLSAQLEEAEKAVKLKLMDVFNAQTRLSEAIQNRDAIQRAMNLTAQFVAEETE